MAGLDYKSCDVCGAKTVYDANLNYDEHWDPLGERPWGVGAWKVICKKCAETYEIVIKELKK